MLVNLEPTLPVDDLRDDITEDMADAINEALDYFIAETPRPIDRLTGCFVSCGLNPRDYFARHIVQGEGGQFVPSSGDYPEFPTGKLVARFEDKIIYNQWVNCYGVCDSPQQFIDKFGKRLEADPRQFVICFTRVRKADQYEHGGWRWHKWGPYVGKGRPTTEYLYDEPKFEEVYCYHIYHVEEGEDAKQEAKVL